MDMYELARGPLAWAAFVIFLAGFAFQLTITLRKSHQKKMLYPFNSITGGIRSILHGIIPFGASYMRRYPTLAIVTTVFHACLLVVPLFLLAHVVVWHESWEVLWPTLPDRTADGMTVAVLVSCLFFAVRRLVVPEAKKLTRASDFILLAIIALPFLSGFLAAHQIGPYRSMLILHVLSGDVLLIIIPFSRLGHMVLFWFSRAYMGAEYGRVMKARDW